MPRVIAGILILLLGLSALTYIDSGNTWVTPTLAAIQLLLGIGVGVWMIIWGTRGLRRKP
jgi:hypothetical protein